MSQQKIALIVMSILVAIQVTSGCRASAVGAAGPAVISTDGNCKASATGLGAHAEAEAVDGASACATATASTGGEALAKATVEGPGAEGRKATSTATGSGGGKAKSIAMTSAAGTKPDDINTASMAKEATSNAHGTTSSTTTATAT